MKIISKRKLPLNNVESYFNKYPRLAGLVSSYSYDFYRTGNGY